MLMEEWGDDETDGGGGQKLLQLLLVGLEALYQVQRSFGCFELAFKKCVPLVLKFKTMSVCLLF